MKTAIGGLLLLGFSALGLALAFNFRGITEEHARKSVEAARPISVLLRRNVSAEATRRKTARQTVLERVGGVILAVAGLAMLAALILGP